MDIIVKLYYEEVPNPKLGYTSKFQTFMQKTMVSICDLILRPQFFKQIQFHYDMNSNSKMFIERL